MKRTLLMVNNKKPSAIGASDAVEAAVREHATLVGVVDAIEPETLPSVGEVDLVITLGGDGTILQAAKLVKDLGAPILGVNTGKVGFMTGYELDAFLKGAQELLTSDCSDRTRAASFIRATVFDSDGSSRHESIALNDFVVTAGPPYGMVEIGISIDGATGPVLSGDGLIVSTPIGSTAYNVSAGGPILAPEVEALVMSPIAVHSLSSRPIAVRADSTITLSMNRVNAENSHGTCLLIDGQPGPRLHKDERIVISKDPGDVRFVIDPGTDYWSTLIHKMGWARQPSADI